MELKFNKANERDVDEIMALYKNVIATTFTTWDEYYPNREIVESDIKNSNFYTSTNDKGEIVAVSFLGAKDSDEAGEENWNYKSKNAFSVARICVNPKYQGKGIGTSFLRQLISEAKKQGADALHLHVSTQNVVAMKMYEKAGFVNTGLGLSSYGFDFYRYEMKL
jgi:ribosomal protein S18 acetylase RimI-like enzyme